MGDFGLESQVMDTNEAVLTKNILHNKKRHKQKPQKAKIMVDEESDEEEFLVKKSKSRNVEKIPNNPWVLSKRQMNKIHKDGPFQGRNIYEINDTEGENDIKPIKGKLSLLYFHNYNNNYLTFLIF